MLIGELCKKAGVSKELVRYYESLGLLHSIGVPAGSRTYRHSNEEAVERLSLIQQGKAIGLTIKQVKPLLDSYLNRKMTYQQAFDLIDTKWRESQAVIDLEREKQQLIEALHERLEYKKQAKGSTCLKRPEVFHTIAKLCHNSIIFNNK